MILYLVTRFVSMALVTRANLVRFKIRRTRMQTKDKYFNKNRKKQQKRARGWDKIRKKRNKSYTRDVIYHIPMKWSTFSTVDSDHRHKSESQWWQRKWENEREREREQKKERSEVRIPSLITSVIWTVIRSGLKQEKNRISLITLKKHMKSVQYNQETIKQIVSQLHSIESILTMVSGFYSIFFFLSSTQFV